ncbi:hypothetical protein LK07_17960 [Streptomyces pluripotens]|uniref:TFIIB-type zinc ribbon-containing protein n=1 Tax=Streptomyces pluripotens TaxID=1355015 RepID=A0A221P8G4_9ACTN|nr:hypothetical protein LK06_016805 [Streptomyces pluripotens]ASN28497.1 hypothetical protein LK07_17960 [Streptomyces pluripotens]
MSRRPSSQRFRDPRRTAYDFLSEISVVCPRCMRSAFVRPVSDPEPSQRPFFAPRRLTCLHCGLTKARARRELIFPHGTARGMTDPYFGLPLLLQTETRHGWLWAYNPQHLTLIHDYVAASLRERAPWYDTGQKMTLIARLPTWIKHAKNRGEMLHAIARIRGSSF